MARRTRKPVEIADPEHARMGAGETLRFECGSCLVEFEITHEPKAKHERSTLEPKQVICCPFCSADSLTFE